MALRIKGLKLLGASAVAFELLATFPPAGARSHTERARAPMPTPEPACTLFAGQPSGQTPAIFFEPGEVLAEFGESYDKVAFSWPNGEGFYLRIIPGTRLLRPLSRMVLRSSISETGMFAMWPRPSGLFSQNRFGSIVVEPESGAGGDLKALSQLFENGELWGIARWPFVRNRAQFGPFIPGLSLEQLYRNMLTRYINFVSTHLRLLPPLVIKAGAVGLKGFRLAVDNDQLFGPFYDDSVEEAYILEDFSPESLNTMLLQFFDALYSASGYERPKNFGNFPPTN